MHQPLFNMLMINCIYINKIIHCQNQFHHYAAHIITKEEVHKSVDSLISLGKMKERKKKSPFVDKIYPWSFYLISYSVVPKNHVNSHTQNNINKFDF